MMERVSSSYQKGEFIYLEFNFEDLKLEIKHLNKSHTFREECKNRLISTINIFGLKCFSKLQSVNSAKIDENLFKVKQIDNCLIMNDLNLNLSRDYVILLNFN